VRVRVHHTLTPFQRVKVLEGKGRVWPFCTLPVSLLNPKDNYDWLSSTLEYFYEAHPRLQSLPREQIASSQRIMTVPLPHVSATLVAHIAASAYMLIPPFPPPRKEWEWGFR
jgi:hypothetical protein